MPSEYVRAVTTAGGLATFSITEIAATTTAYADNQTTFAAAQQGLEILVEGSGQAVLQVRQQDGSTWSTGDLPILNGGEGDAGWHFFDLKHTGFRLKTRGATPAIVTVISYTS